MLNVLVSEKEAHRLLTEEGACLRDTRTIKKVEFQPITGTGYSYTSLGLLNKIIYARVREIISRLNGELSRISYEKTYEIGALQGGIVLTGGGSKIRNIDQTIRELMGENYRKSSLVSLDYFRDVPEEIKKDSTYLSVFGIVERYRLDLIEESFYERSRESISSESSQKPKASTKGNTFKTFIKKITGGDEDAV